MEIVTYNIRGTCEVMGIGRSFVYELIADGHLDARKIGRRTVITAKSIRQYVESRPIARLGARKAS